MTGNLEPPDGGGVPADPRLDAERPRIGRVTELALVAAGLGAVVYLLGFVDSVGLGAVTGPLLVGGGLLAGSVALPAVGTRVLLPAAVGVVTGALFTLQGVVGGNDAPLAVGVFVLALLEAVAVGAALLLQAGVVRAPRPKVAPAAPPQQPGYPPFPGQQYPGQPYPGAYPGGPYGAAAAPPPYPGYPSAPPPSAPPGSAPAPAAPPPSAPAPAAPPLSAPPLGDQYAGENAYAQNARYGAPYGVPGYPPPPPHGGPGYDPAVAGDTSEGASGDAPTTVGSWGQQRSGEPASAEDRAPDAATSVHGTGAHRAADPDPAASSSGLFGAPPPSWASSPEKGPAGTPSTGSHAAAPDRADPEPDDGSDDRTRSIPRVSDER